MIEVVQADITTRTVDAIVNAASPALRGGGGVDGAIHRAAGPGLLRELLQFEGCDPGAAVRTGGHALSARWVIHAVGPIWHGGHLGEPATLRRAYDSAFARALETQTDPALEPIRTIAFPAISTGVYGYPKREAAHIAIAAMRAHEDSFDRIVACLFDASAVGMYQEVLGE